jgi:26S proteasome regulatory subunit T2
MGQGQSGGLPSKQRGIRDQKGDANTKKEKKYEPATLPTRVGKKQRKQKGPEATARLLVVHACHQV